MSDKPKRISLGQYDAYQRKGGCPVCGPAAQIEGGSISVSGTECWQKVSCLDCDAAWTDVYTLSSVQVVGHKVVTLGGPTTLATPPAAKPMPATIRNIVVKWASDTDPDLSHIGEYTDSPVEHSIYIEDSGEYQCQYFTPAMTAEETGNPDSPAQDFARIEACNRGDWWMLGVSAVAYVVTPSGAVHEITSGGCWGIESDSGDEYHRDMASEQLNELYTELEHFGFATDDIDVVIAKAELLD